MNFKIKSRGSNILGMILQVGYLPGLLVPGNAWTIIIGGKYQCKRFRNDITAKYTI
ncbi:MAG TPA: hypothetical protein PKE30_14420 [Niabella sp.]|nr:hypothetical protein [Niabella sp.]